MAQQHMMRPRDTSLAWPPDDTEESILGTDLDPHQEIITDLRGGLVQAAAAVRDGGPASAWTVSSQTRIDGFRRADGRTPLQPRNRGCIRRG